MKGSCQCGSIQYEVPDDFKALIACYCTECQKMSAGVGSYSMFVAFDSFQLTSGELSSWERSADTGARNIACFCPICSNRIYHKNPEIPGVIRVKAGTLENANRLEPDAHFWMRSAPEWIRLPEGALAYDTQPGTEEALLAIQGRRNNAVSK